MKRFLWLGLAYLLYGCFLDSPVEPRATPDELEYNYWLLQHLYIHPEQLQALDIFYEKADSLEEAGAVPTVKLDGLSQRQFFAVASLYRSLPDPYTRYVPHEKVDAQKQQDTSTVMQGGLGIELTWAPGASDSARLEILRVYEDSPADSAGLQKGDRLVRINGLDLRSDSAYIRFSRIMADSTWIRIDLLRATSATQDSLHVEIQRGTVYVPTVFIDSLDGVVVLELRKFMRTSVRDGGSIDEFRKSLRFTKGSGTRVLDLRGNPGGEIGVCLDMADEFIGDAPLIHLINHAFDPRGRGKTDTTTVMGEPGGEALGERVVIAIDSNTASCAEIFIAALKDNLGEQVTLVGTRSYGKAIGQSRWDTPGKGLAIITSLEIRTPQWVDYQGKGILPDVQVDQEQILTEAVGLAQEQNGLSRKSGTSLFARQQLLLEHEPASQPFSGGAWVDSTEINP